MAPKSDSGRNLISQVGLGPSRTSFAGFGLRRIPSLLRRIWAGFWSSSSRFGANFALVLERRLEDMEPRRWLAAAVLMCLLVLCGGRGRLLALVCLAAKKKVSLWISSAWVLSAVGWKLESVCRLIFPHLLGECGRSVMRWACGIV
jgi:hypothetical protein